ncbi:1-deoxy-D-xylulose-5-phosphate synthase [Leifsonia poae]|uniref:1-deoxy-D-xylulose-5-phosphate synthase n=1 Tax=Leifsonia poae TaxID=110933 RepID=UPI003D66A1FA
MSLIAVVGDRTGARDRRALLPGIRSPRDLDALTATDLRELAAEIREFLIECVSRTGGHLGPNLGVVELTIALHRVFDSPRDPIVWDVGHQTYVHKMLTGRRDFSRLRASGGLGAYPLRRESEHDILESSHGSASLSWAEGIAAATGDSTRTVVAVVGDGALTGGMIWEALNNIGRNRRRNLVIVLNDNGRSYAPTIGGLARFLGRLRTTPGRRLRRLFDIAYLGPVDGHDLTAVEEMLRQARAVDGPVLVHVITEKGRGYAPALADEADRFHAVGQIESATGRPASRGGPSWTSEFGRAILAEATRNPRIVAVTAAMLLPTGLGAFVEAFPDRVIDVGMAEQHAVASAAGLAYGGMHPVVALYSTFLSRAYDQLLLDVGLHRAGVTFVLDRAGATGPDGASHHGMWDLPLLLTVPGMRVAAPRDAATLRELLTEALAIEDGPTALRFPRGRVAEPMPAVHRLSNGIDVLRESPAKDVLLIAVGAMASLADEVADDLAATGVGVTVVDPRWVAPIPAGLDEFAEDFALVATIEDGVKNGGVGSRIQHALRSPGRFDTIVFGLDDDFLLQGSRGEILESSGLERSAIARTITHEVERRR